MEDVQQQDRDNVSRTLDKLEADFNGKMEAVKDDFVTEIKDNIKLLGDNIDCLENAIHDDVNKLKEMVCDLGDNLDEEKLSRQDDEKKLTDFLNSEVNRMDSNISDRVGKLANDLDNTLDTLNGKIDGNAKAFDDKIDLLGFFIREKTSEKIYANQLFESQFQYKMKDF